MNLSLDDQREATEAALTFENKEYGTFGEKIQLLEIKYIVTNED